MWKVGMEDERRFRAVKTSIRPCLIERRVQARCLLAQYRHAEHFHNIEDRRVWTNDRDAGEYTGFLRHCDDMPEHFERQRCALIVTEWRHEAALRVGKFLHWDQGVNTHV